MFLTRRAALLGFAAFSLTACVSSKFETAYDPVSPDVSKAWRLSQVRVNVPKTLTVSEANSLAPKADIVWREDPLGDRYAQVGAIVQNAVQLGAKGLRGSRPVIIDVTVTRFHALTFEAEMSNRDWGVHNIDFNAQVVDAKTGEVLLASTHIRAEFPAFSGAQMRAARQRGETQKSQITAHVAATVAGWLGLGPDVRGSFSRMGS